MLLGWLIGGAAFFTFCYAGNVSRLPEKELYNSYAKQVILLFATMLFQIATDRMDESLWDGFLWTLPCMFLVVIGKKVDRWKVAYVIQSRIDSSGESISKFCTRFAVPSATVGFLVIGIAAIEASRNWSAVLGWLGR
jgi:hypothetical protein